MNTKRKENMIDVFPKRRILMWHEESQGNPDTVSHTTIPHQSIESTRQGMIQALHVGEYKFYWKKILYEKN